MAGTCSTANTVTITQDQLDQLIAGSSGGGSAVNNTVPTWNDITVNGKVITSAKAKEFFLTTLDMTDAQYNHLSYEGIKNPDDFVKFDSDEIETVFTNSNKSILIKAYSQIKIKQVCDWAQYLCDTGRTMIEEYLVEDKFKNHAISWKSLQESKKAKDVPSGLPKLGENTDILSWFHQVDLTLTKIIGHGYVLLAYVIRKDQVVTVDPPEQLLPGKCYSKEHGSLQNELIARYSHSNAYFDENNQMRFGLL